MYLDIFSPLVLWLHWANDMHLRLGNWRSWHRKPQSYS